MKALLDVSTLVALFDGSHALHDTVGTWFHERGEAPWATCAITQNCVVRILSQPTYPNALSSPAAVAMVRRACQDDAHEFWSCDLSITDPTLINPKLLFGPNQLTDLYLLALAVQNGGCFVTLGRRITPAAVTGATSKHLVIL